MSFRIILDGDDLDNPIVAEVTEGGDYWYVGGLDMNDIRLPKWIDDETERDRLIELIRRIGDRKKPTGSGGMTLSQMRDCIDDGELSPDDDPEVVVTWSQDERQTAVDVLDVTVGRSADDGSPRVHIRIDAPPTTRAAS